MLSIQDVIPDKLTKTKPQSTKPFKKQPKHLETIELEEFVEEAESLDLQSTLYILISHPQAFWTDFTDLLSTQERSFR